MEQFNYGVRESTQQSFNFETILKLNLGKKAVVWMSFPNAKTDHDQIFTGEIVATGIDHLVLKIEDDQIIILPSGFINNIKIIENPNYESSFFKRAI